MRSHIWTNPVKCLILIEARLRIYAPLNFDTYSVFHEIQLLHEGGHQ